MPSGLEDDRVERVRVPADVLRPAFDCRHRTRATWRGTLDALTVDTRSGTRESDKMITAVKAWIAERLGAEGADDPERLDQAFEHLARAAFAADVTPAGELTSAGRADGQD